MGGVGTIGIKGDRAVPPEEKESVRKTKPSSTTRKSLFSQDRIESFLEDSILWRWCLQLPWPPNIFISECFHSSNRYRTSWHGSRAWYNQMSCGYLSDHLSQPRHPAGDLHFRILTLPLFTIPRYF